MHYWSLYFLAKLGLYLHGSMHFNWLLNLLLAIFVTVRFSSRRWRILQQALAIPIGIALAYFESSLPPFSRVIQQAGALAGFSSDYMMELLSRIIHPAQFAMAGLVFVLYLVLSRRIRFTSIAFLAIFCVPLIAQFRHDNQSPAFAMTTAHSESAAPSADGAQDPAAMLDAFYAEQKNRQIVFPSVAHSRLPFDVVILHICSFSWDDLDFIGEAHPSLFNRFDVVFRNFNSAASYSGPAAIRVLRSTCGQQKHADLYDPVPEQCYLLKNFMQAGYDAAAVLNHDGVYGGFGKEVEANSGIGAPEEGAWGDVAMHAFDGTPIYGDFSVLSRWWTKHRSQSGGKPMALYYNTITMHDGNKLDSMKGATSLQSYKPRIDRLLGDFDRFISQLEAAGRPVVVIMVPEHGAALRGDKVQISGMREIPNPKVTTVPVAIKLIGLKHKEGEARTPLLVDKPTSYNAVFSLLADFMANNPYEQNAADLAERLQGLPETRFVSENEKIIVMRRGDGYLMRSPEGTWINYDDN